MPASPPPPAVAPSGMYRAATILLLVGAILHAVGAVAVLGIGAFFLVLAGANKDHPAAFVPMIEGIVYLVLGLLLAAGTVFGFTAHARAVRGNAHGAWVHGLVAALLPPLQVVTLLGAIFCLVSPEGEAAQRARRAGQTP